MTLIEETNNIYLNEFDYIFENIKYNHFKSDYKDYIYFYNKGYYSINLLDNNYITKVKNNFSVETDFNIFKIRTEFKNNMIINYREDITISHTYFTDEYIRNVFLIKINMI